VYIGPFYLEYWHLGLIAAGLAALGWFVMGFLVPITGTWERVDEDVIASRPERITLVQFGPFVRGRRMMKGGFQEFSGYVTGRSVTIGRIDHGKAMIMSQGFPEAIAEEVDGTLTARLKLTLSQDARALFGTFAPRRSTSRSTPPRSPAAPSRSRRSAATSSCLDRSWTPSSSRRPRARRRPPPAARFAVPSDAINPPFVPKTAGELCLELFLEG
jgi:hypothetical protein